MALRGVFHLATARLLGNPLTFVVGIACSGLGPLLAYFQRWAPIQDGGAHLGPAWIQLLALAGASGGLWALSDSHTPRRLATARQRVVEDALVVATYAALTGWLAAASLAWSAVPAPMHLLMVAPLKLGALGALGLAWGGGRASAALLTLWGAVWILPQGIGSPASSLLGLPLEPSLLAQVLASSGLLLVALSMGQAHRAPATSIG